MGKSVAGPAPRAATKPSRPAGETQMISKGGGDSWGRLQDTRPCPRFCVFKVRPQPDPCSLALLGPPQVPKASGSSQVSSSCWRPGCQTWRCTGGSLCPPGCWGQGKEKAGTHGPAQASQSPGCCEAF